MKSPAEIPQPAVPAAPKTTPRASRSVPLAFDAQAQMAAAMEHYKDDADFVTALARGLAVMMALSERRRRIPIAQVSHVTGIARAAARRSLHTLAKLGFVAMDDANLFYLRPRILSVSHSYLSASPLAMLSQPILDRLGEETGESCSLAVLDSDEIVYLARSSASRVISPSLNAGRRIPAYWDQCPAARAAAVAAGSGYQVFPSSERGRQDARQPVDALVNDQRLFRNRRAGCRSGSARCLERVGLRHAGHG
jgi:DNA-binding IclR family transcriptional regulator